MAAEPIRVLVTGAAGQIAYSLLCKIANGEVFGPEQPVILHMLDIPVAETALGGVVLELQDCAFPLLAGTVATVDVKTAFTDIDVAILVGAMPRRQGQVRADLLKANAGIFKVQGQALNDYAKKDCKVLVVGNPANTNAWIAANCCKNIPKENFTALTRLDHNRAQAQIALKLSQAQDKIISAQEIKNVTIWGNHSGTQYPDAGNAKYNNESAKAQLKNDAWLESEFITTVQGRGKAIIDARKLSSAMSAAKAICDHVRDWWVGTPEDSWVSMGVWSTNNPYGIADELIFSFPVTCKAGSWKIVEGLNINEFSREKMNVTEQELKDEKKEASAALGL